MPASNAYEWTPRPATEADVAELEALIPLSTHALQSEYYTPAQINAALGPVFGVDRRLIRDGTYFVVEHEGRIIGCGGWSRRKSLYGGDGGAVAENDSLDPAQDAARIRAFFVHPDWARRGIARAIVTACEGAIAAAGFRRIDLVATLTGEPLYASFGYAVVERFNIALAGALDLPAVRMTKALAITVSKTRESGS